MLNALLQILSAASVLVSTSLPAVPSALGFGSDTVGGSGRHLQPPKTALYRISSLADSGSHTLRECAQAAGPRTCIFDISGRIKLASRIIINEPYLTIAGQSAPSPGILITGAGLEVSTHDVLVQHLAIRVGDDPQGPRPNARDAITVNGKKSPVYKVLLDHLSLSWALDENFSTYSAQVKDVTLSNSIVSEGLHHSIHPDGPHGMGILIGEGSQSISIHHCLLSNNNDRNPRQKAGSSLEFLNNVVYNWGGMRGGHTANPSDTAHTNAATLLSFAGNYYLAGPASPKGAALSADPPSANLRVFVFKNFGPTRTSSAEDEWKIANFPEKPYRMPQPPFEPSGVPILDPSSSKDSVLRMAGARPHERDAVDRRLIEEVQRNTGSIKDCVAGCPRAAGGWPEMKSQLRKLRYPEGMSSTWKPGEYTELERFLHCLANTVETGAAVECS